MVFSVTFNNRFLNRDLFGAYSIFSSFKAYEDSSLLNSLVSIVEHIDDFLTFFMLFDMRLLSVCIKSRVLFRLEPFLLHSGEEIIFSFSKFEGLITLVSKNPRLIERNFPVRLFRKFVNIPNHFQYISVIFQYKINANFCVSMLLVIFLYLKILINILSWKGSFFTKIFLTRSQSEMKT